MIVKKIGQLLFLRLKLFKILAKLSPLMILGSLYLFILIIGLNKQFKFQEPSLRTTIYDLSQKKTALSSKYIHINKQLKVYMINGIISNQCLIISLKDGKQFKIEGTNTQFQSKIIRTLQEDYNLAKNVVFLRYNSTDELNHILKNPLPNWGIPRAALNLDIQQPSHKLFFKLCNHYLKQDGKQGLYADQDYYLALKQLLQIYHIKWSPCQVIHQIQPFKIIKNVFESLFFEQIICQLHETLSQRQQIHSIFLKNSIQAATLRTVQLKVKSAQIPQQIPLIKLQKIVLSFIKQFSIQQDHLHSSSTLYYPVNHKAYLQVFSYMLPSLLFMISVVIWVLSRYWQNYQQQSSSLNTFDAVILLIVMIQWYLRSSVRYSLYLLITRTLLGTEQFPTTKKILIAIQALFCFYFGVFNLSLSIICMILSLCMIGLSQRFLLGCIICIYIINYNYWNYTVEGIPSLVFLPFMVLATMKFKNKHNEQKNLSSDRIQNNDK